MHGTSILGVSKQSSFQGIYTPLHRVTGLWCAVLHCFSIRFNFLDTWSLFFPKSSEMMTVKNQSFILHLPSKRTQYPSQCSSGRQSGLFQVLGVEYKNIELSHNLPLVGNRSYFRTCDWWTQGSVPAEHSDTLWFLWRNFGVMTAFMMTKVNHIAYTCLCIFYFLDAANPMCPCCLSIH